MRDFEHAVRNENELLGMKKEQAIRDLEQQAKALSDAHKVFVENKMFRSARDYIDFRALELLEMAKALKEQG